MARCNCQFHHIPYNRLQRSGSRITNAHMVITYLNNALNAISIDYFYLLQIIQRLPFDTKNLIGFFAAVFILNVLVFNLMVIVKCFTIFGFGTCSMLFSLTEDIKCSLRTISHTARYKRNRSKSLKQLCQFVQFHSELIQLSPYTDRYSFKVKCINKSLFNFVVFRLTHSYSDLLKIFSIIILSWSIAAICVQMLLLKMMVKL